MVAAVCSVINIIGKSLSVVDAGHKVYVTCSKDKMTTSDKVNVAAQGLFMIAQVSDIGMQFAPSGSNSSSNKDSTSVDDNARLGISIAVGTMDVTRTITHKVATNNSWSFGDALDIVGILAFRGSDAFNTGLQTHKNHEWICVNRDAIENGVQIAGTLGQVAINRNYIHSAGVLVYSGTKKAWRYIRVGNAPASAPARAPAADPQAQADAKAFNADQDAANQAFEKEAQAIQNWKDLVEIPAIFAQYPAFSKCRLSGRAIRHILIPNFKTNDATLIYDKHSLEQWMKANPEQSPPGWPKEPPFSLNSLSNPVYLQDSIDEMLAGLAKELAQHSPQQ